MTSARSLISKVRRRGLVTRLKPGLYSLVPFELGHATEHVGDPYLLAEDLIGDQPHYLSHASALELHRMVTQPTFTIYASCVRPLRAQTVAGYDYRFIRVAQQQIFGLTKIWITKERAVTVSDIERTIIDGLRQPLYAGGVSEVAKGLWMKRDNLSVATLMDMRADSTASFLYFLLQALPTAGRVCHRNCRRTTNDMMILNRTRVTPVSDFSLERLT